MFRLTHKPGQPKPGPGDRREGARTRVEDLRCNRGEILDLSQSGARILTWRPWRMNKVAPLVIVGAGGAITLEARCVWTWKEGLFRHVVGVYFESVTPEQRQVLHELAREYEARSLPYREAA